MRRYSRVKIAMNSTVTAVPAVDVRPADGLKMSQSAAAIRKRRSRIRKLFEASGSAFLYVECRECGKPIKPSFKRGFCPGGTCREAFFKKVQVPTVVRLTAEDKQLSERVLIA